MSSFLKHSMIVSLLCAAALAAGCGGGSQSSSQATAAPTTEAQREQAALPTSQMESVPKDLKCKGAVVWVNMHTKSYHESGDPYYGRTKNGKYMCQAAADAAGYHMAGSMHSRRSNMMNGGSPSDNGTPSDQST